MSRSVSLPQGAEMVVFLYHGFEESLEWDDFIDDLRAGLKNTFKSFRETDRWLDRESHAILENDFGVVTVNEYMGVAAISFVPIDFSAISPYDHEELRKENLCYNWMHQIDRKFKKVTGQYGTPLERLGHMSNGAAVYRRAA